MEAERTPAQWLALLAGTFLATLGALTLIISQVRFGTTSDPGEFLVWQATGWNTILWIVMGAAGIVASARVDASRSYAMVSAVVFGVLAVWGIIDAGATTMGIFAIGWAGNATHAALAALSAVIASVPEREQREMGAWRSGEADTAPLPLTRRHGGRPRAGDAGHDPLH